METNRIITGIMKALLCAGMTFGFIWLVFSDDPETRQFSFTLFIISGVLLILLKIFSSVDFPEISDSDNQEKLESND